MAKALGVSPSAITSWKKGERTISEDIMEQIAALIGVSIEELRDGSLKSDSDRIFEEIETRNRMIRYISDGYNSDCYKLKEEAENLFRKVTVCISASEPARYADTAESDNDATGDADMADYFISVYIYKKLHIRWQNQNKKNMRKFAEDGSGFYSELKEMFEYIEQTASGKVRYGGRDFIDTIRCDYTWFCRLFYKLDSQHRIRIERQVTDMFSIYTSQYTDNDNKKGK